MGWCAGRGDGGASGAPPNPGLCVTYLFRRDHWCNLCLPFRCKYMTACILVLFSELLVYVGVAVLVWALGVDALRHLVYRRAWMGGDTAHRIVRGGVLVWMHGTDIISLVPSGRCVEFGVYATDGCVCSGLFSRCIIP